MKTSQGNPCSGPVLALYGTTVLMQSPPFIEYKQASFHIGILLQLKQNRNRAVVSTLSLDSLVVTYNLDLFYDLFFAQSNNLSLSCYSIY